jgi:hypothetical protein
MSYDAVRHHLSVCRDRAALAGEQPELLEAIEELATAIESDLVQIKTALSHVAYLLESQSQRGD